MKIACIGGGPFGLYFSILMKKADPSHEITVYERNKLDDTFGWGVVFSDETLGGFEAADAESMAEVRRNFAYWSDIDVFFKGEKIRSTGHGFCGLARVKLLQILEARAVKLGTKVEHLVEVTDLARFKDADLIVACDGVNSRVRDMYAQTFKPSLDWRKCKFCWLGLSRKLPAFTFIFKENEHGLFQVHAYPFDDKTSTFIVECREEVWKKAGLDKADEAATVAYMEKLFAEDLQGAKLLTNRSLWRTFPTIRNERWHHENVVLVGDAVHTAHFSIGSGTKLAMEDAIELAKCLGDLKGKPVREILSEYEKRRRPEVERLQKTAQTSLEWFENTQRYMGMTPLQLTFALMTRSKSITYDNLRLRDPELVRRVAEEWLGGARSRSAILPALPGSDAPPDVKPVSDRLKKVSPAGADVPPPAFAPFSLRGCTLANRIVVSPMCMYSYEDGMPSDWTLVHLGSRAVGGAGLIIAEATAVAPEGRITPGCAGIYRDEHVPAWKRVVDFVHAHSVAKIGLQIGHAGRKASCDLPWKGGKPLKDGAWQTVAPSALAYDSGYPVPREMTLGDIAQLRADFTAAAKRALAAGFDWLELHCAHGYLLNSFISALSNKRNDEYGGTLENRMRLPLEILRDVRAVWPADKPISVRLSTTEWAEGGLSDADRVYIARALVGNGADIIDCSAGGVVPHQKPVYGRMFQVPFSDQIRNEGHVPTMAVGNIQNADQCNTILAAGRADLCMLARAHLANPYLALHAAEHYDVDVHWPNQYLAAKPRRRKG
ncbi:anthraniloyl-CoA monooxygenase [Planctomycetaceae bacterium]|nr:anthraniloyl-CoA monooxygenase [Planctomycetaceae bacterium]